jgi:CheY-like chemotaxis protein
MPGMTGFEFIRKLHEMTNGPRPPVIAMTGLGSGSDHTQTRKAGFQGHLDKPFDEVDLLRAIESAVGSGPHD